MILKQKMNQNNEKKKTITISEENLSLLSSDVSSLWANTKIATLDEVPTPLTFLREYVLTSTPLIIKNAFPIVTMDDLIRSTSTYHGDDSNAHNDNLILNVDVTPDGYGDCIRIVDGERVFVMPEVRPMSFDDFRDGLRLRSHKSHNRNARNRKNCSNIIDTNAHEEEVNDADQSEDRDENGHVKLSSNKDIEDNNIHLKADQEVFYYSRQNDCLRMELQPLTSMFPPFIPFANEAFDAEPDAINLWIGNENSTSSMHKDHYENIFCVASGQKLFTICPPADALFIKEESVPSGTFRCNNDCWTVDMQQTNDGQNNEKEHEYVRWIECDVERIMKPASLHSRTECMKKYPLLEYAHPIRVCVEAGDMLYLPALWYHKVTQSCETVAVNYWYDMRFDSPNWCYFNFLQHLHIDCDETFKRDDKNSDNHNQ